MSYRCSIYGLGISANRPIPGVPSSPIESIDVNIHFGSFPAWIHEQASSQPQLSYTAEHTDNSGQPLLRVFRVLDGKYHHFRYADDTEFVVDHAGAEIWTTWTSPLTIEDTATYLLGPVMGFVMLLRGIVCLHASAIVAGAEAVALVGPAGSGKSTTAAAFATRGFSVLADDVVTLDDRAGKFLVRPAYPCIRLWPASVKTLYGSESHLPKLTPNWDKRYLDLTPQFPTKPVPLSAIYLLGQRRDEPVAPFVEALDHTEALLSLIANTYTNYLIDKSMQARQFDLLTRVLAGVPVRRVTPHADAGRIQQLCDCVLDDVALLKPHWSCQQDSQAAVHV
ncbi:MAG TPA: hypothetical protein VFR51_04035 [Pyrinomonadaceae bacterium]|nr:hypothetical protein [Pyrinomonadaceae bacterium]